jgi:ubiquinone/menaquinone biosynthesis C-methylase UbiE
MLNLYLRKYAEFLDELNYRVDLLNNVQYEANRSFLDGDYWSTEWFRDFWHHCFRSKLESVGLRPSSGARVLDCCAGQGYLGNFFELRFGAQAVFCDLSQAQLKALLRQHGLSNGTPAVCMADLLKLPFPTNCFDWVVGNSFLHHLSDVPGALAEMYRVLKVGGTVVFFHEPSTTSTFWQSFPLSLLKNTTPTEDQVGFTDLWVFTSDDLRRLMEHAGFSFVQVLGTGIISSILMNWYTLTAIKLNWRSRTAMLPAYLLRSSLNRLDTLLRSVSKTSWAPSLMVLASK